MEVLLRILASDGLYWGLPIYRGLLSNKGSRGLRHRVLGVEFEFQGLGVFHSTLNPTP